MKLYKPAYLYIKTHNKTDLKYFGKTTQNPFVYPGSGTDWLDHININGYDVTTELLNNNQPYLNESELIKVATEFSIKNDIVKSKKWANKRIENGDGGDTSMCENYKKGIAKRDTSGNKNPMFGKTHISKGKTYEELYGIERAQTLKQLRKKNATGRKLSADSINKMSKSISLATKGKSKSESFKQKLKKAKTEEHKKSISKSLIGKKRTIEHSKNLSNAIKNSRATCTYCGLLSTKSAITRYHNENCRNKNENN